MIRREFEWLLLTHLIVTVVYALALLLQDEPFLIVILWSTKRTFGDSVLIYVQTEFVLKGHKKFEKERQEIQTDDLSARDLCSTLEGYLQFVEYLSKFVISTNLPNLI